MAHIKLSQHWARKVICALNLSLGSILLSPVQAQTLNWAVWDAPDSFPLTMTASHGSYRFTNNVTGKLAMPDGSIVDVNLSGEVLDESCFTAALSGCPNASSFGPGSPSTGWWKNTKGGWAGFPAGTFTSANVPTLPNNQNLLAMSGIDPAYAKHTLTFSRPVSNIVMNVASLGGGAGQSTYSFTQDFNLLSQDTGLAPLEPLVKTGKNLTGKESSGTIQFVGTFTSLEWTVSQSEYFSGFNFASTSLATSSLILSHQWAPGAVNGDHMQATTSGGSTNASIVSAAQSAGNANQGVAVALTPGDVVTFPAPNYTASAGASYSSTLSCTSAGQPRGLTGSSFPYQLTIAVTDQELVCEYVTINATPVQKTGTITITKTLAPLPAGAPVTWPQNFNFTATCNLPTAGSTYTASASFNSAGSQAATIANVPEGAVCSLSETQPAAPAAHAWDAAAFSPASVTVAAGQTASSAVTNRLQTIPPGLGTALITKTLAPLPDGAPVTWPLTFSFTATCDKPAANTPYTTSLSFTAAGDQTATLTTIPEGSNCTLTEALPATPSGYTWDAPAFAPATISIVGGQSVSTTITNILRPNAVSAGAKPVPSNTLTGLAVMTSLIAAFGIRQRRHATGKRSKPA